MRIVVVEDAAPIREGLAKILHKVNEAYTVVGMASDGAEGLRVIEKQNPDLVIMDIQMPDMDGLTMLSEVRRRQITSKVIVLTAYSDFNYAKKAIELGIENYLLKPIKIEELKRALSRAEESLRVERQKEQIFTLDYLFKSSLSGQRKEEETTAELIAEKYGFHVSDPFQLFLVSMDGEYGKNWEKAAELLEQTGKNASTFDCFVLELEDKLSVGAVIYRMGDPEGVEAYFRKAVTPMLFSNFGNRIICSMGACRGLAGLKDLLKQLLEDVEWNLLFPEGTMLTHGLIGELDVTPFVFPMDLEMRLRRAVSGQDMGEYRKCLEILKNACTGAACQPREIRDACIRFFMTMIQAFKDYKGAVEGSFAQEYLRNLSVSNTWDAVMEILISFFEQNTAPEIEKEDVQTDLSPLVQKARALIQEYYCQGITLEETARRLRVSDEYLSTQFKKETGKSFTETVRAYRVEKIKKLLRESNLKLNQIAAMTGYSDPKYMSKVFREEVGMLPAEYRKK